MFWSSVTLEEYLKSIEHEAVVGEDVSFDDIDMFPNLKEEDLATMEEDTCDSRVLMNMNSSLITIPDDFKDDREVLIIVNIILHTHVIVSLTLEFVLLWLL